MAKITSTLLSLGAASLLVGLVHTPAHAFTLTPTGGVSLTSSSVGQSFTVNFDGNVSRTTVPGLTSQAVFRLTGFSGNTATFDVALTNNSSAPITGSRVSSIGFNTNPDITSATVSGVFSRTTLGGAYPNNFGSIDICFTEGNNCQGGRSGGVTLGQTQSFSTTLNFAAPLTTLTLDNFGARYQSIDGLVNGKNVKGDSGTGRGTPHGEPIPEPASMLGLLAFGALGGGALKRKKAKAAAAEKELMRVG